MGTSVILLSSLSALLMLISVQAVNIGYGPKPCKPGEVFSACEGACEKTCSNMAPICAAMCKPGCVCRDGTVRNASGKCIRKQDCCKGKMVYFNSGNDKGRVCPSRTRPPISHAGKRYPGCFCKAGYLLLGNKCVRPKDCPKIRPSH
ncbi:serine protease inhibitor swm-1-like [Dendropsophus ebraccatus]|uniref:serine protease inhibitor swm-1-like n=1 Tax=Dendropsophus ebraccatus TaxID=150705 RepID=UPI003831CA97